MKNSYTSVIKTDAASLNSHPCESPTCPRSALGYPVEGPGGVDLRLCENHAELLAGEAL